MPDTTPKPAVDLRTDAPGPRHRRRIGRRTVRRITVAALTLTLLGGVATSAVSTADRVDGRAKGIERDVGLFAVDLSAGRLIDATSRLDRIENQLRLERADLRAPVVRAGSLVPLVSGRAADAQRLVTAAEHLQAGARHAVELQTILDGGARHSALVSGGRLDPAVLAASRLEATGMHSNAQDATAQLLMVRGGPGSGTVAITREAMLAAATDMTRLGRELSSVLPSLPELFGGNGPRSYLVVLQDERRPLPSGGDPLAVVTVTARTGQLATVGRLRLDVASKVAWEPAPRNAYSIGPGPRTLADAFTTPHFPVAGEEVLRWAEAGVGRRADGVVALDATALSALLAVAGPIDVPGIARPVTAGNVTAVLDRPRRQARYVGGTVLQATLRQLLNAPATSLRQLRAFGWASENGHLRTYARQRDLQRLAAEHGLSHDVRPVTEDVVGLLALGGDEQVDALAHRETRQDVVLSNGSAVVTRTTTMRAKRSKATSPFAGPRTGASTGVLARPLGAPIAVRAHLPLRASHPLLYVDGKPVVPDISLDDQRRVLSFNVPAEPQVTVVLRYRLAMPGDRYQVRMDGQPVSGRSRVIIRVHSPMASQFEGSTTWQIDDGTATTEVNGASTTTRTLEPARTTPLAPWWRSSDLLVGPWLLVAYCIARLGRRRPGVPVAVALVLYGLVPTSAAHLLTGTPYQSHGFGPPPMHPASWVVLLAFWQQMWTRPATIRRVTWERARTGTLAVTAVLGLALLAAVLHGGGLAQMLENLVVAPALLLLIVVAYAHNPALGGRLRVWVLRYALAMAGLAVVEGLVGRSLFYSGSYAANGWAQVYERHGFRATTLLDHPLNTTLLLSAALPLAWAGSSGRRRAAALALLAIGIVATGSRSGVVIAAVTVLALASARLRGDGVRRLAAGWRGASSAQRARTLAGTAVVTLVLCFSPVARSLLARLAADGGSAALRLDGVTALLSRLDGYLLVGSGVGSAESVTRGWLGTQNSAENPIVMLVIDIGLPGAVLVLVGLAAFAGLRLQRFRPTPHQQALVVGFFVAAGYSSFGTRGIAVVLVWLLAALCAIDTAAPPENGTPLGAAESKEEAVPMSEHCGDHLDQRTLVPAMSGTSHAHSSNGPQ